MGRQTFILLATMAHVWFEKVLDGSELNCFRTIVSKAICFPISGTNQRSFSQLTAELATCIWPSQNQFIATAECCPFSKWGLFLFFSYQQQSSYSCNFFFQYLANHEMYSKPISERFSSDDGVLKIAFIQIVRRYKSWDHLGLLPTELS